MNRHVNDPYVKKSKTLNYRSRGAFKLLEIQDKYKFLRPGQWVLDVGAAPGGWSQVIVPEIKSSQEKPTLIAVDINPMQPIVGCHFVQGSFVEEKIRVKLMEINNYEKFDVICSDMCPEFVGDKFHDHTQSFQLNLHVIDFARTMLKKKGVLLLKSFDSKLQNDLVKNLSILFKKVSRVKPSSSRSESSEMFLFCIGFLENEEIITKKKEIMSMTDEQFAQREQENLAKYLQLARFSSEKDEESQENLKKIEEAVSKQMKFRPGDSDSFDKEACEKIKQDCIKEEDEYMSELEGRNWIKPEDRSPEAYTKKFEKEMEMLEQKYQEALKNQKVSKEDEKLLFDNSEVQEYINNMSKELENEFQNVNVENELHQKMQEEEEEKMAKMMDENQTRAQYNEWENVLKKVNDRRQKLDGLAASNSKIHRQLEESEQREVERFNNEFKNLRKDQKEFFKKGAALDDSLFDKKNRF